MFKNRNTVFSVSDYEKSGLKPGIAVKRLANCIRWHQDQIDRCRREMRALQKDKLFDPDLGRQVRRSTQTIEDLSSTIFDIKRATGVIPSVAA